ncbi:sterol desaturase family [Microdochium trichocladiopsis]|uniref:Sterol desaturase family n=1 Tax=Microdochium trichocladiopsis TaxID=1682393 RepID=A0A9P8YD98_9PEZI|nr:sterol desaturase family [Microdochium trichocladiopsis]KAH7039692.1 sterol desaturase family [Microdochium trichocladiopsis]
MDLIMSLPILSYFAAPMMTSWSTSLNLLFFYMTWSTLVLSHDPIYIEIIGTTAIKVVFWLLPSLLFLAFDALVPSLAESIKHYGRSSLPRRDAASLAQQVILAIFNVLLCGAVEAVISFGASTYLHRPLFKSSTTLPLPWQIIKHILTLYTLRELLTYYIHRFVLHSPHGRGGAIARLHGSYAHASRGGGAPYALMLFADHPLPLFLNRLVPVYLPALVLRPHLLTYFAFTLLTTIEETASMSGYSIVPGIVLGGIARRTATHYASGGQGNYGAWGFLDWVSGTSVGRDVIEDLQDEADKHHVRERGKRAAIDAGSTVQDGIDGVRKTRKGRKTRAA